VAYWGRVDARTAHKWADVYMRGKGPQSELVKQWLASIDRPKTADP